MLHNATMMTITNDDITHAEPLCKHITELVLRSPNTSRQRAAALAMVLGVICEAHSVDLNDIVELLRGTADTSRDVMMPAHRVRGSS